MPVIRPSGRGESVPGLRDRLARLLVKELLGEGSRDGPVIFEMATGRGSEVDVVVVWEAWKAIPPADRTAIIREAYAKYGAQLDEVAASLGLAGPPGEPGGPPAAVVAIGATRDEALSQGLLPYLVEPHTRAGEVDADALRYLMIEAGAIESPAGVQLRFPDARLAADVHARLVSRMPEANWAIAEEAGMIDD